jgi:hypothetical protein
MSCRVSSGSSRRAMPRVFGCVLPRDLCSCRLLIGACLFPSVFLTIFLTLLGICAGFGQTSVLTQHYDNARTGQNITETVLTPANVNSVQFGKLFTQTLDGQMTAQPLYVPGVFIPALNSTHNVVYAATMHDSVYAFDADNNQGTNVAPLWHVNFLNPANGVTTVPQTDEGCSVGYTEFGIQGTPVIDPIQNAIYVLAVTKENGIYVHRLHALNLGTGAEMFGGPVVVTGSVTIGNQLYTFIDKYQQDRAALLLQDGIIYIGFGGPGCNVKTENGWVMAYNDESLKQVGVFNASPGVEASAVWLSGAGLAGDGAGNIYASTGDGLFDVNSGGSHYGDSVLKFNQGVGVINLMDYFTPYNQLYFQEHDLDVSSGGITLLPPVPQGNFAVTVDKNGTIYLLNEDGLGGYNSIADIQIPQEIDAPVKGQVHGGLTYWNSNLYLWAYQTPVLAYSFADGQLSPQPTSQTPKVTANPQGGIVSSNGANDAIFWYVTTPTANLFAFDATNLATEFYDSTMVASRDKFGPPVHFEMPIVADGRVYVNGQTQLAVFGLLPAFTAAAGNNQTGAVGSTLPVALQAALLDPYSGSAIQTAGIPVTFKASEGVGVFSNKNATTNSSGIASTYYTLPPGPEVYTITASSPGYASATFTVTATASSPTALLISSGNSQKAPVGSPLPLPLSVKVKNAAGAGVAGIQVSFSGGGAGTLSSPTATSNSSGIASVAYTTGTVSGATQITASVSGLTPVVFKETVLAGPASAVNVYGGNNQTVGAGKAAAKLFQVIVTDQYGNPVPNVSVSFSDGGAGGSFSVNPALTATTGIAGTRYTAPTTAGPVSVTATVSGLGSVLFTINVN